MGIQALGLHVRRYILVMAAHHHGGGVLTKGTWPSAVRSDFPVFL